MRYSRRVATLALLLIPLITGCGGSIPTATAVLSSPAAAPSTILPPTHTALPTATPVPPTSTPCPVPVLYGEGTVTGQVILPAEVASTTRGLALDLFFENVATEEVRILSLPEGRQPYTMTLPAGSYVVYAWTPALAEKGAFTSCRPGEPCEDLSLRAITVTAEAAVTGVDIADWLPVERPSLALVGTLIDGTGADPIPDAALVIREQRVVAVGPRAETEIPVDARVINLPETTLLPGFINAHVHNTHQEYTRKTWAREGVTTVRDLGARYDGSYFPARDRLNQDPENARALIAGPLVTVPGGYPIVPNGFPSLVVTTPEVARHSIARLIDLGADVIKITMESTVGPILSPETAAAIVETAHERGIPVSVHVTRLRDLECALDAGVDDIAHMVQERVPDAVIERMVEAGVTWVPTLEPFHGHDSGNLRRFIDAGGVVAMGNDSGYLNLKLGMPMPELEHMHAAGMTTMEVIVASTRNAAYVCRRLSTLGTLEAGKFADVLVVEGNPLEDLHDLENVRLVVHSGVIIREEVESSLMLALASRPGLGCLLTARDLIRPCWGGRPSLLGGR